MRFKNIFAGYMAAGTMMLLACSGSLFAGDNLLANGSPSADDSPLANDVSLISNNRFAAEIQFRKLNSDTTRTLSEEIIEDTVNFELYTPTRCIAAANRVYKVATRAYVEPTEGDDGLPTATPQVRKVASECVARFDPNTVDERELISLVQAYISAGNSTLRDAAIARKLSLAGNTDERIRFIRELSKTFFAVENLPIDESGPETFLSQLDSINTPAAKAAKVEIFADIAVSYVLGGTKNIAGIARAVEAAMVAGKGMDSIKYPVAYSSYTTALIIRNIMSLRMNDGDQFPVGTMAPRLQGEVVVGEDRSLPASGRLSLVVFQRATSRSTVVSMRKIAEEFGDKIDIVFVGKTQGHYQGKGPLSFDEESKMLAQYYKTELNVPGSVIMEPGAMTKRPDGRITPLPAENERAYGGVAVALIAPDGKFLRVYTEWMGVFEDSIREVLEKNTKP